MNALGAVVQVVDFMYKAIIAYAKTPEGEKELQDVADALGVDTGNREISISEAESSSDFTAPTSQARVVRPNSGG